MGYKKKSSKKYSIYKYFHRKQCKFSNDTALKRISEQKKNQLRVSLSNNQTTSKVKQHLQSVIGEQKTVIFRLA